MDSWHLANGQKQVNNYYARQKGFSYKGCDAYGDFRELLRRKNVDAVMITTPDHRLVTLAIEAAPLVCFEGTDGWIEIEYPDKLTASSQTILDSLIGAGKISFKDLPSDKEDFLLAIKNGKQTIEPLEAVRRTI